MIIMAKVSNEKRSICFKRSNKECGSARKNPTCASRVLKACFRGNKKKK